MWKNIVFFFFYVILSFFSPCILFALNERSRILQPKGPRGAHRINLYRFHCWGSWGHSPGQSPVSHARCFSCLVFFCKRARRLKSGKTRLHLPGRAGSLRSVFEGQSPPWWWQLSADTSVPFRGQLGRAGPVCAVTTEVRSCFWEK